MVGEWAKAVGEAAAPYLLRCELARVRIGLGLGLGLGLANPNQARAAALGLHPLVHLDLITYYLLRTTYYRARLWQVKQRHLTNSEMPQNWRMH